MFFGSRPSAERSDREGRLVTDPRRTDRFLTDLRAGQPKFVLVIPECPYDRVSADRSVDRSSRGLDDLEHSTMSIDVAPRCARRRGSSI